MILQIIRTAIDEDDANVWTFDIDLTDDEVEQLREFDQVPEGDVEFRGKTYEMDSGDICDILHDVVRSGGGKLIVPDHTIEHFDY